MWLIITISILDAYKQMFVCYYELLWFGVIVTFSCKSRLNSSREQYGWFCLHLYVMWYFNGANLPQLETEVSFWWSCLLKEGWCGTYYGENLLNARYQKIWMSLHIAADPFSIKTLKQYLLTYNECFCCNGKHQVFWPSHNLEWLQFSLMHCHSNFWRLYRYSNINTHLP